MIRLNLATLLVAFYTFLTSPSLAQVETRTMPGNKVAAVINAELRATTQPVSCKARYRASGGHISTKMAISESTLTITFPHRHQVAFEDHTQYMDYILGAADHPQAFAVQYKDGAVLLVPQGCGDPIILSE